MPSARARRSLVALLVCAALLVALLATMQVLGKRGRNYLAGQKRVAVPTAQGAYDAFVDSGVRGRVLVVFDKTSHLNSFSTASAQDSFRQGDIRVDVPSSDLVALLIHSGMVREAYVVFPENEWARASKSLTEQGALVKGSSFESWLPGAHVTLSTTPPTLSEKAVVYVNAASASEYAPGVVDSLTMPAASDLVVTQGGGSR